MEPSSDLLNVESIFSSIDGEFNGFLGIGQPSTFIRLRGCNLRCTYPCDTPYAQEDEPKKLMSIEEVLAWPGMLNKLTITGGEPLLQMEGVRKLLSLYFFDSKSRRVSIETNGSICPFNIRIEDPFRLVKDYRLRVVADYKLPSSGMENKMNPDCFLSLRSCDVIKFVVKNNTMDLQRTKELLEEHRDDWRAIKAISPCWSSLDSSEEDDTLNFFRNLSDYKALALQVVNEFSKYLNVTFSVQLHKILSLP